MNCLLLHLIIYYTYHIAVIQNMIGFMVVDLRYLHIIRVNFKEKMYILNSSKLIPQSLESFTFKRKPSKIKYQGICDVSWLWNKWWFSFSSVAYLMRAPDRQFADLDTFCNFSKKLIFLLRKEWVESSIRINKVSSKNIWIFSLGYVNSVYFWV